jgi:hypothetical protein
VQVDYASGINVTVDSSSGWILDRDGPTGLSAVTTLWKMVYKAQGILSNVMGDHLTTIKAESKRNTDDMVKPLVISLVGSKERYTDGMIRRHISKVSWSTPHLCVPLLFVTARRLI